MEPERGFEPLTYHLRGGCSAWLSYSGGEGECTERFPPLSQRGCCQSIWT
jgi:hypothetical protein